MGLRFHRSFQLFPGVRLNLSKSGLSASFGVPGATLNVGPHGLISTVGIPGTGLSYRQSHGGGRLPAFPSTPAPGVVPTPSVTPGTNFYQPLPAMREINSASIEELTSSSLRELRDMIAHARSQKAEIDEDLREASIQRARQQEELERKRTSLLRFFYQKRIAALEESLPSVEAEVHRLQEWRETTKIAIHFDTAPEAKRAYACLVRAFDKLRGCDRIWDVTSDRATDRVAERTLAGRSLSRNPVILDFAASDLLQFEGQAMRFGNVNGEPILIYPGMVMMPRQDGAFALVELREVRLECDAFGFHEEEGVPADSEVAGFTWAKTNKDGSPDRRFANNYQIPVCRYGRIEFSSSGGILEEYLFSNAALVLDFGHAFQAYQTALSA